ncbi:MAG: hypothetical protein K6T94_06515 [Paenibacillus sp.]|nr:hypothetical protein [Paenibacillus sp.]
MKFALPTRMILQIQFLIFQEEAVLPSLMEAYASEVAILRIAFRYPFLVEI